MLLMAGMNSMLTLMCISVFRWVVLTQKVTRPEIKCWQHNCVNLNLNNQQQQSVESAVCAPQVSSRRLDWVGVEMVAAPWTWSLLLSFPPLLGWGSFKPGE